MKLRVERLDKENRDVVSQLGDVAAQYIAQLQNLCGIRKLTAVPIPMGAGVAAAPMGMEDVVDPSEIPEEVAEAGVGICHKLAELMVLFNIGTLELGHGDDEIAGMKSMWSRMANPGQKPPEVDNDTGTTGNSVEMEADL